MDRRIEFAHKPPFASIAMNVSFLSKIIFADKATFHLSGLVNRLNCYYYSQEDPSIIWEKPVNPSSVCVCLRYGLSHSAIHIQRQQLFATFDYFIWSYLRELVYKGDPITDIELLKAKNLQFLSTNFKRNASKMYSVFNKKTPPNASHYITVFT